MITACFATILLPVILTLRAGLVVDGLLVAMLVLGIEAIRLSSTRAAFVTHLMSRAAGVLAIDVLIQGSSQVKKLFDDFGSELPDVARLAFSVRNVLLARWGFVLILGFFVVEAVLFRVWHDKNARSRLFVRVESALVTSLMACVIVLLNWGVLAPIYELIEDLS